MKITTRLQLAFVSICLFVAIAIALVNYSTSRELVIRESFDALTALREVKKRQILDYFRDIDNHARTLADSRLALEATEKLHEAFHRLEMVAQAAPSPRDATLDHVVNGSGATPPRFIDASFHLRADADRRAIPAQYDDYERLLAVYQPFFQQYIQRFGFDDLLLTDEDGHVIYSAVKSPLFATSLISGPYRDSHLAAGFRAYTAAPGAAPLLVDFARLGTGQEAPAAFVIAPIMGQGGLLGVLILQISIEKINDVMTNNYDWSASGLGSSGETYLVGPDLTMRNDSRFLIEQPERYFAQLAKAKVPPETIAAIRQARTSVLLHRFQSSPARNALAGSENTEITTDYRGVKVLSAYAPVIIGPYTWAIIAKMDAAEAFAALDRLALHVIAITALIALGLLVAGNRFSSWFAEPLKQLLRGVNHISAGNFSHRISLERRDEIGELAQQFNEMSATLGMTTISKDYLDGLLSSLPDALFVVECSYGLSYTIQHINPASASLFGTDREQLIGRNSADFFLQQPLFTEEEWTRLLAERHLTAVEKLIQRTSGEAIPVEISASLLTRHHSGSTARHEIVCIAHDITERKAYEARIRHLADYDHLTGLTSRRLFHERLVQALGQAQRYSRRLALLYVDLDGFKFVNDTLGHDAGDELLIEVARRLSSTLRESDIVGRQGGDEFTIIMPEIGDRLEVIIVAQKILTALQRPFDVQHERVRISATIGIALAPADATDADRLMKRADEAMYQAKRCGKAWFHFAAMEEDVSPAQTRLL